MDVLMVSDRITRQIDAASEIADSNVCLYIYRESYTFLVSN